MATPKPAYFCWVCWPVGVLVAQGVVEVEEYSRSWEAALLAAGLAGVNDPKKPSCGSGLQLHSSRGLQQKHDPFFFFSKQNWSEWAALIFCSPFFCSYLVLINDLHLICDGVEKIFTKCLRAQDWLRIMPLPQLHMSGIMNLKATGVGHKVSGTWRDLILHGWGDREESRDTKALPRSF